MRNITMEYREAARTNARPVSSSKDQVAAQVAAAIVNVGLTAVERDRWRRCATPGAEQRYDGEWLELKYQAEAVALSLGLNPYYCTAAQYARAVVSALEHDRAQRVTDLRESLTRAKAATDSLESELDRLRRENEWLREALAAREAAE